MHVQWFFIGLGLGVLLTVPVAARWSRRTQRRARVLERRAQRAERLGELGTMTGGLAHEIKNPLSTLGLNIQLLQEDLADARRRADDADDAPQRDALDRVLRRLDGLHREAQRLRDILDDFLRFAGRINLDPQPTDLHALLAELADFFAPQADQAHVRLRTDLQADPAVCNVDGPLLKQAVLNLLINAVQAMQNAREADPPTPHGGADELLIRTANDRDLQQPVVRIHITDTGPGIPDDLQRRIFEPYFSSKRGGTGLGLPTTGRIIEEHGGTLRVHSEPGRGSDFVLTLPAGDPAPR